MLRVLAYSLCVKPAITMNYKESQGSDNCNKFEIWIQQLKLDWNGCHPNRIIVVG